MQVKIIIEDGERGDEWTFKGDYNDLYNRDWSDEIRERIDATVDGTDDEDIVRRSYEGEARLGYLNTLSPCEN